MPSVKLFTVNQFSKSSEPRNGDFLLEAALLATRSAPGRFRSDLRGGAARDDPLGAAPNPVYGADADRQALAVAAARGARLEAALGVGPVTAVAAAGIADFAPPQLPTVVLTRLPAVPLTAEGAQIEVKYVEQLGAFVATRCAPWARVYLLYGPARNAPLGVKSTKLADFHHCGSLYELHF